MKIVEYPQFYSLVLFWYSSILLPSSSSCLSHPPTQLLISPLLVDIFVIFFDSISTPFCSLFIPMADPFIVAFPRMFCLENEVSIGDPPATPSKDISVTPQPPPIVVHQHMREDLDIKNTVMSSPEPASLTRQTGLYESNLSALPELSCKECRRRKSKVRGTTLISHITKLY